MQNADIRIFSLGDQGDDLGTHTSDGEGNEDPALNKDGGNGSAVRHLQDGQRKIWFMHRQQPSSFDAGQKPCSVCWTQLLEAVQEEEQTALTVPVPL